MDALKNRSFASYLLINHIMILHILINVCERLFDELVKEWLQNRYTIVSGTFRETNGCKVRIRKGHLRRYRDLARRRKHSAEDIFQPRSLVER